MAVLAALDFSPLPGQSLGVQRLIVSVFVCLLYLSVAFFLGIFHDHHEDGTLAAHKDCVACAWNINSVADVPVVVTTVVDHPLEFALHFLEDVSLATPFVPATASRAPPAALA